MKFDRFYDITENRPKAQASYVIQVIVDRQSEKNMTVPFLSALSHKEGERGDKGEDEGRHE